MVDEPLDELLSRWQEALRRGAELPAEELCRDRPELLPEVQRRIQAIRQMERLAHLANPPEAHPPDANAPLTATHPAAPRDSGSGREQPTTLAGYEIQRELGRGGMGVVYEAYDPRLRRTVAIKQLLFGRQASADEVARFQAEARALARLQHPNIVQVFDTGEHDGQAFFVLEFCPGGSLADRLRGTPLPPNEAAAVCVRLAAAVQAAHANRVVHRDLKPQNVLIADPAGAALQPDRLKVSDFGLAKNLDEAGLSGTGDVLGTPSYMAPEQVRPQGHEVGPAADVWALGAILYELLTGRPPFRAATRMETLLQVVEDDPASPRTLNRKVPRDLETICLKCLRKDPGHRYATAGELADDLARFLAGEPVRARPVGRVELAVCWARRNPGVAALSASLLLLLVGGLVSVTRLYLRADAERTRAEAKEADAVAARAAAEASAQAAREQEARARAEADKARSVVELLTVIFEGADTLGLGNSIFTFNPVDARQPTALDVVERGAALIESTTLQPEVRATLLDTIGTVYFSRGQYEKGEKYLREGYELRRRTPGVPPLDLANSHYHLGRLATDRGGKREAETHLREALRLRREHGADPLALSGAQFNLAMLLILQNEPEEAEALFRDALTLLRKALGDDHPQVAATRLGLATCHIERQDWWAAGAETGKALDVIRRKAPGGNLGEAITLFQQGVYKSLVQDDQDGAVIDLKESLRLARQGFGARHIYPAIPLFQLGVAYENQGKLREAEEAFRECLEILRERQALGHPRVFVLIRYLARLVGKDKPAEADRLLTEGLTALRAGYGGDHAAVADALVMSATVRDDLNDLKGAEKELTEAISVYEKAKKAGRRWYAIALYRLGGLRQGAGRLDDAAALYRRCLDMERRWSRQSPVELAWTLRDLLECLMTRGQFGAEVDELLAELETITRKLKPLAWVRSKDYATTHPQLLALRAWNHRHYGRHAEAAADAVACRKARPTDRETLYRAACVLGGCAALAAKAELPTGERDALARKYADEAMATLREAVRQGFKDRQRLDREPDLAPLRGRADYAELFRPTAGKQP